MKVFSVRLAAELIAEIEAESRGRGISKSDVVRERLERVPRRCPRLDALDTIADLIGSVDGLPPRLSVRKKQHLRSSRYGEKRPS